MELKKFKKARNNITAIPMGLPAPTDETIFADNHTLFIDRQPAATEPILDEKGVPVEGYFKQEPAFTVYKLFIGTFDEAGNGIQRILAKLQEAEPEDILEFHISSRGGVIDELLEIYNLCDTLFYGRVTTYCNYGYSAGAMAFLFGQDRLVYEHSDWMMHSYSGGFGGKRQDLLDQMAHEDKKLENFFSSLMEPYFTKKEIKKIQKGKDYWLNSEEMLKRGIATHIMVQGELITAQDYIELKNPEVKEARIKAEKKLARQQKKNLKKLMELDALEVSPASEKLKETTKKIKKENLKAKKAKKVKESK